MTKGILFFLFFSVVVSSCRFTGGDIETPPSNDPIDLISIDAINFFFDDSGSMQGYYPNKTEFHKNVSDIITQVEKYRDSTVANYITVSNKQKKYEVEEFKNTFLNKPQALARGKSTRIDWLLKSALDSLSESNNNISILVTDGILSLEGSIDKLEDIGNKIDILISKHSNNALKMYAFYSQFRGELYPYETHKRTKIKKTFDQRPYYIFYMGKPEVIEKFERQIGELPQAKEMLVFNSMNSFDNDFILSNCSSIPMREANTNVTKDNELNFKKANGNFKFLVHANLPSFCKAEKIKLFEDGNELSESKIVLLSFEAAIKQNLLEGNNGCQINESKLNSVIQIELKNFTPNPNKVLEIKYLNNWHQDWSSEDDEGILPSNNKTFGLEVMVRNIAEGYSEKKLNPIVYLFNWKIPIKKK